MTQEFREPTRPVAPPLKLRRERDGSLFDLELERSVDLTELAADVKDGRRFRVARAGTGTDCTNEVLVEILRASLPDLSQATRDLDAAGSTIGLFDQLTRIVGGRQGGPRTGAS